LMTNQLTPRPPIHAEDTRHFQEIIKNNPDKLIILDFFATWCGPCLLELPHIQKLWDDNRENDDFVLIAIAIGREDTNESVTAFQSKHGYTFPMASDPQRASYSLFAAELIPRTYLVSRDGTICFTSTGFYEEESARLQRELAKQLRSTP